MRFPILLAPVLGAALIAAGDPWAKGRSPLDDPAGQEAADDEGRKTYRKKLAEAYKTDEAADYLKVAAWAEGAGLRREAWVAFEAVLIADSDDPTARKRLGFVAREGRWLLVENGDIRPGDLNEERGFSLSKRLPGDVRACAALAASVDVWERYVGLNRLQAIEDDFRLWLDESLRDESSDGYNAAVQEVGWRPPTGAVAPEDTPERITRRIDEHVRKTRTGPVARGLVAHRKGLLRDAGGNRRKVRRLYEPPTSRRKRQRREELLGRWSEARKSALEAIRDPEAYHRTGEGEVVGGDFVAEQVDAARAAYAGLRDAVTEDLAPVLALPGTAAAALVEALEPVEARIRDIEGFLEYNEMPVKEAANAPSPAAWCFLYEQAGAGNRVSGLRDQLDPWEQCALRMLRNEIILRWNGQRAAHGSEQGPAPSATEAELARLLNEHRIAMGLPALAVDHRLTACARDHSEGMAQVGRLDRGSSTPGRRTPAERAQAAGFVGDVGELLHRAEGKLSVEDVVEAWCGEPEHHRSLLEKDWDRVGCGIHDGYVTQMLGARTSEDDTGEEYEERR